MSSRGVTKFLMPYKINKTVKTPSFLKKNKHVNCHQKRANFTLLHEFNCSFQNEQIDQGSEVFNQYTDSQEDIDSFVKAQKSENTVKKTTSNIYFTDICVK